MADVSYCTQCGTRLPEHARFCPRCGAPVATVAKAAVQPARATVAAPPRKSALEPAAPLVPDDPEDADGGGWKLLVALALLAAIVVAVVFWQQRDGARPLSETDRVEPTPTPSPTLAAPPVVEELPAPAATPAEAPDATALDVETGLAAPARPARNAVVAVRALDAALAHDPRLRGQRIVGPLNLRGTVTTSYPDDDRASVGLTGEGDVETVIAYFADDQRDAVALLDRGAAVRLRCDGARRARGTTVLDGCRL